MDDIRHDVEIDVRGLSCPRPLLKAKQSLEKLTSGQVLKVLSDDRTTRSTFPSYLRRTGDVMVDCEEVEGVIIFHIRKK